MFIEIDSKKYEVIVIYKNNKNMYLRVKDDLNIYITAPKYMSKNDIEKFINDNILSITKMIKSKESVINSNKEKFLFLGKKYDICYINDKSIYFGDNRVFIGKGINIDNYLKKECFKVFNDEFIKCLDSFKEINYIPKLRIRKMSTKWGVCNVTKKVITLNSELIKIDIKYLNYVIYHELSHLVYPNHSKDFWFLVEHYVPNYKNYKKEMKNIL